MARRSTMLSAVLVLVLVASAIANRSASHTAQLRPIILMYLVGTVAAALLAVTMSVLFPTILVLQVADVALVQQGELEHGIGVMHHRAQLEHAEAAPV